jgi:hypothetical protein
MKVTRIVVLGSMLGMLFAWSHMVVGQNQQPFRPPMALDQQPVKPAPPVAVVSYEEMSYPHVMASSRIRGAVVVRAQVGTNGRVIIASSISGSDALASVVLPNIKQWVFESDTKPIDSHTKPREVIMVYAFYIEDEPCNDNRFHSFFKFDPPNLATITACGFGPMPQTPKAPVICG